MLFNSLKFLFIFLPITVLGFHLFGRYGRRPVIAWLAFMSVVFYAAWNPVFVVFLLGSIAANYLIAMALSGVPEDSAQRKRLLALGVGLNLLGLFYFKYLYKVLLLVKALHLADLNPHPILLPLGISFADLLPGRFGSGAGGAAGFSLLPPIRYFFPAFDRGADSAPQGDDASVRAG
jgi:D-alanyl-lipoteichoic acid acyltransferase DltB (MBOAT superfamily)